MINRISIFNLSLLKANNFRLISKCNTLIKMNYFNFAISKVNQSLSAQQSKKLNSEKRTFPSENQHLILLQKTIHIKRTEQIDDILKKLMFLNKSERQGILKSMLSQIITVKTLSDNINNKRIINAISQFPNLVFDHHLYNTNALLEKLRQIKWSRQQPNQQSVKQLFNKLNSHFQQAFTKHMKNTTIDNYKEYKAVLFKYFAIYHLEYLHNIAIVDKDSSIFNQNIGYLKKARQFFEESAKSYQQVLAKQETRLKLLKSHEKVTRQNLIEERELLLSIKQIISSINGCINGYSLSISKQHSILKNDSINIKNCTELNQMIETYQHIFLTDQAKKIAFQQYLSVNKLKMQNKIRLSKTTKNQQQRKKKIQKIGQNYIKLRDEGLKQLQQTFEVRSIEEIRETSVAILSMEYYLARISKKSQQTITGILSSRIEHFVNIFPKTTKHNILEFKNFLSCCCHEMIYKRH